MWTPPFIAEVPDDLGHEAAWLGRDVMQAFLERKWARGLDYRLIKKLCVHDGRRITVRFAYEWHDDTGNWFRSYGNENWEFDDHGTMHRRFASIKDKPIAELDRKFHWPQGRRPDEHPGLTKEATAVSVLTL